MQSEGQAQQPQLKEGSWQRAAGGDEAGQVVRSDDVGVPSALGRSLELI